MTERIFSAPGRIEIGGNHTDHQHGRVLAAAIDLEARCAASVNGTNVIRIDSDGFGRTEVDVSDLRPRENEKDTTAALIRGIAAWFREHGYKIGGFDGHVTSAVPGGSGLSSSAAFEVLIGNTLNGLFNGNVSALSIALAGQYAENVYSGKPCGLMDQLASSIGGLAMIDFKDPEKPIIQRIGLDLSGYEVCVVSTGGSHADLTGEYAAIPQEMKEVASFFGKQVLREVRPEDFYANIAALRQFGDRAVLRAFHFFEENERVLRQADALEKGDMRGFLEMVIQSGQSSMSYLQNVYTPLIPKEQGISLAYALSEHILAGAGAYRVHGGGFAGTLLAFVPLALKEEYKRQMSAAFGEHSCHFLNIRKEGGMEVKTNG